MGEGVSLSLPQDGFSGDCLLMVSVPFLREYGFSGGFNLPRKGFSIQFVFSVPLAREHGFSLTSRGLFIIKEVSLTLKWVAEDGSHSKGMEEVAPWKASGLCDAFRHEAEQELPIPGQQVPLFIGSGDPALTRGGD